MKNVTPLPYATPSLPAGTKVQGRISGRLGVVQRHRPNRLGTFPVAWCDGSQLWSGYVTADEVAVVVDTQVDVA